MVENREIKLTAFADDLTTFLQGIQSFQRLSITLDRFGICSGSIEVEHWENWTELCGLGETMIIPHTSALRKKLWKNYENLFHLWLSQKTRATFRRNIEIAIENFEKMGMETSHPPLWENSSREDICHTQVYVSCISHLPYKKYN